MALTLNDLEKKGAFPVERLIKKVITWRHVDDNGEEITDTCDIFVKCLSVSDFSVTQTEESKNKNFTALMISESLRLGDKGEDRISYEKALQLDGTLASCLFAAISDVLWGGNGEKKLAKKTKSGTS